MIAAGKLRHRIAFVREEMTGQDASGAPQRSDKVHARVWAELKQLSGTELVQAQQKKPNSTHRVTTRYVANVTADLRILHGERTLHIENVDNVDERNIELVILCREEA